jgi:hypothetical protein
MSAMVKSDGAIFRGGGEGLKGRLLCTMMGWGG